MKFLRLQILAVALVGSMELGTRAQVGYAQEPPPASSAEKIAPKSVEKTQKLEFVSESEPQEGKSKETSTATVKFVDGVPYLFLRAGKNVEFQKGPRLAVTKGRTVTTAVGTWNFSPDGTLVAVGSAGKEEVIRGAERVNKSEGAIDVFDAQTGARVAANAVYQLGPVRSVRFSDDGKKVLYYAELQAFDGR